MRVYKFLILGFLCCVFAAVSFAGPQPQNFMVGSHVFTRPESWDWVDLPNTAKIAAKMNIGDPGSGQKADVVFLESKAAGGWASAKDRIEQWKKNFAEAPEKQNLQLDERQIGKIKVTFLWQEGTYQLPIASGKIKLEKDFAQYGVVIENGKNNVLARVLGGKIVVQKAKAAFKKMIESALDEE